MVFIKKAAKYLKDFIKKSQAREFFRYLANLLRKLVFNTTKLLTKVNDKQIIFFAYGGRSYACSPRAIYEAMLKDERFSDYRFIWSFKKEKLAANQFLLQNRNTSLVAYNAGPAFSREFLRSKTIVANCKPFDYITLRKSQILVQSWHGTPLKKLGYDVEYANYALSSLRKIKKQYTATAKQLTYLISPSRFASEKFTSAFDLGSLNKEDAILEVGYPRNDFLFNYTDEDVARVKRELGISPKKKVCLYAPTWRDDLYTLGVGYSFPLPLDFTKLKSQLGDYYVIVFRPHYFIADRFDFSQNKGFVVNGTKIDDINDLYIIADTLITDYSSVFFDYANLKRPMIFFMFDLDNYQTNLRDFYIELDELPGPIVRTQEELAQAIIQAQVSTKLPVFNAKFNYLDSGNVSEKVIDIVYNFKK